MRIIGRSKLEEAGGWGKIINVHTRVNPIIRRKRKRTRCVPLPEAAPALTLSCRIEKSEIRTFRTSYGLYISFLFLSAPSTCKNPNHRKVKSKGRETGFEPYISLCFFASLVFLNLHVYLNPWEAKSKGIKSYNHQRAPYFAFFASSRPCLLHLHVRGLTHGSS